MQQTDRDKERRKKGDEDTKENMKHKRMAEWEKNKTDTKKVEQKKKNSE